MSTFGNVSFILKAGTVTYIIFEESSSVEASCRCDYLNQYPVTIRSVVENPTSGSIETCILEQIEQNSSLLVEEEGQLNNFIQLLDMENLDEYLEQDEKEKNTIADKPLLEVGNEEIIATESDDASSVVVDDLDVDAIEKQALRHEKNAGTVLVDNKTAKILKLSSNSLQLSELPQFSISVQKIKKQTNIGKKATAENIRNNKKSKSAFNDSDSARLDKHNSKKAQNEYKAVKITKPHVTTETNKTKKNENKKSTEGTVIKVVKETQNLNSLYKETAGHISSETHDSDEHRHVPMKKRKVSSNFSESEMICDVQQSANAELMNKGKTLNVETKEAHTDNIEISDSVQNVLYTAESVEMYTETNEGITHQQDIRNNSECESTIVGGIPSEDTELEISQSVPDACNTIEINENDSGSHIMSEDENALVIDLPDEADCKRLSVVLDSKSAVLFKDKVHGRNRLYIDRLPKLSVRVKHVRIEEFNSTRKNPSISTNEVDKPLEVLKVKHSPEPIAKTEEPPIQKVKEKTEETHPEKSNLKKSSSETNAKRKEDKHEKTRKTDLEKIDNKFLPAGSKLKAQAKAKLKQDNTHKKHLPVPELPIELKAHLNTSFKIPKKRASVQPVSIDRNPTELDCLHREQARSERDRQRKRFQKERKRWENKPGQATRESKPAVRSEQPPPVRAERQPSPDDSFDVPMDDAGDSPLPSPSPEEPVSKDEVKLSQSAASPQKSSSSTDNKAKPSFQDIWNLPSERPEIWAKAPAIANPPANPWNAPQSTQNRNTIDFGDNWDTNQAVGQLPGKNNSQNNNTLDSQEPWSSGMRKNINSNTITAGESWSPEAVQIPKNNNGRFSSNKTLSPVSRNVFDNRNSRSPFRQRPEVNRIDDGETWSPDLNNCANVESFQQRRDMDTSGRRPPLQTKRSRSPRQRTPPLRKHEWQQADFKRDRSPRGVSSSITISSGDMWDTDSVTRAPRHSPDHDRENTLLSGDTWDSESNTMQTQLCHRDNPNIPYGEECSNEQFDRRKSDFHFSQSSSGFSERQSPDNNNRWRGRSRSPYKQDRDNFFVHRNRSRSRSPGKNQISMDCLGPQGRFKHPSPVRLWNKEQIPDWKRENRNRSPVFIRENSNSAAPVNTWDHEPTRESVWDRQSGNRSPKYNRENIVDNRLANKAAPRRRSRFSCRVDSPEDYTKYQNERDQISEDRSSHEILSQSNYNRCINESPKPFESTWDAPMCNNNNRQSLSRIDDDTASKLWTNKSKPSECGGAYSPSSALDVISSEEEECDFMNPSRIGEKGKHTVNPLLSTPQSSFNEDVLHDSFDPSRQDALERKNVLENLKQRAERLKKLEDMKQARQKLLAQIKVKSDRNENEVISPWADYKETARREDLPMSISDPTFSKPRQRVNPLLDVPQHSLTSLNAPPIGQIPLSFTTNFQIPPPVSSRSQLPPPSIDVSMPPPNISITPPNDSALEANDFRSRSFDDVHETTDDLHNFNTKPNVGSLQSINQPFEPEPLVQENDMQQLVPPEEARNRRWQNFETKARNDNNMHNPRPRFRNDQMQRGEQFHQQRNSRWNNGQNRFDPPQNRTFNASFEDVSENDFNNDYDNDDFCQNFNRDADNSCNDNFNDSDSFRGDGFNNESFDDSNFNTDNNFDNSFMNFDNGNNLSNNNTFNNRGNRFQRTNQDQQQTQFNMRQRFNFVHQNQRTRFNWNKQRQFNQQHHNRQQNRMQRSNIGFSNEDEACFDMNINE